MKVQITFEIDTDNEDIPNFGDAKDVAGSLHEALCQGIHEGNKAAWAWLQALVQDIT